MNFNIPWNLFQKLHNNSLSLNEKSELEYWRDSSDLNTNIYNEIVEDELFKTTLTSDKWDDNSQAWNQIVSRIQQPAKQFTISRQRFMWISVAAAVIFLFSVSTLLYQFVHQNKASSEPESYTYIFSPRGQRTRVVLPDNTKVWLNSESSLKYSTNYNSKYREVIAQGEAFFEVTHNPDKPFYVLANEVKVKVYGTSFNIRAFINEKTIEATLIEGKMSITTQVQNGKEQHEVFLKPNEKCIITRDTKYVAVNTPDQAKQEQAAERKPEQNLEVAELVIQKNIDPIEEKVWKDGKLVFRDQSFGQLAIELERWYDVKIHFQDEKIKQYKFTGSFDKETINQAMEALKFSSQKSYQYNISFRDIYLKSK